jgi:protein subunit release factor A
LRTQYVSSIRRRRTELEQTLLATHTTTQYNREMAQLTKEYALLCELQTHMDAHIAMQNALEEVRGLLQEEMDKYDICAYTHSAQLRESRELGDQDLINLAKSEEADLESKTKEIETSILAALLGRCTCQDASMRVSVNYCIWSQ